jgi:DNA-binding NtrC family response regulator
MEAVAVLTIDDEETVQNILTAFVHRYMKGKEMNCNVKAISDPVQGLFELSTNGDHYAVILLDVRLPKLTGDEIYNSLVHVNPGLLSRVMFVTGYPDDIAERFPDKELRILQKPFRYEQFSQSMDAILQAG